MAERISSNNELSRVSRTEVEQLNRQETPGDGSRFPGRSRTISGQVPQGERTQQELPQQEPQRGRGSSRIQILDNNIIAEADAQNVGASDFDNVRGQRRDQGGGYEISGNRIAARGRAKNVGFHNFGNTTSDASATKKKAQQELPQVNMDRHDQGGGGSSRNQIRGNIITAEAGAQNVGASDFDNVRGQSRGQGNRYEVSGNSIAARGRAENVGFHNFGNTTSDASATKK